MALAALGVVAGRMLVLGGVIWATLLIGTVYLWGAWLLHVTRQARVLPVPVEAMAPGGAPLLLIVLRFLLATAVLVAAAWFLIQSAEASVEQLGLTQGFFGIVVLAVVTSLPEIVVSAAGIRAGSYDLVVGNSLGSNAFNRVILLVLDLADGGGSLLAAGKPTVLVGNLFAIVLTGLVVLGTLSQAESRYRLLDAGAVPVVQG